MKTYTGKQVFVLVLAIVAAIAFVETSHPLNTGIFWRAFIVKVLVYGLVAEFAAVALGASSRK